MTISENQARDMLRSSARQMGLLYLSIGRKLIESYGEDGKKLLLMGVKQFGQIRGSRIAARVREANLPLTLENYFKYYDVPVTVITKQEEPKVVDGKLYKKISSCPLAEFFREENEQEIGKIYCEQDFSMVSGYNTKISFEKGKSLMNGDECCEFLFSISD